MSSLLPKKLEVDATELQEKPKHRHKWASQVGREGIQFCEEYEVVRDTPKRKPNQGLQCGIYSKYLKQYVHKVKLPNPEYEHALKVFKDNRKEKFIEIHLKSCKREDCYWRERNE